MPKARVPYHFSQSLDFHDRIATIPPKSNDQLLQISIRGFFQQWDYKFSTFSACNTSWRTSAGHFFVGVWDLLMFWGSFLGFIGPKDWESGELQDSFRIRECGWHSEPPWPKWWFNTDPPGDFSPHRTEDEWEGNSGDWEQGWSRALRWKSTEIQHFFLFGLWIMNDRLQGRNEKLYVVHKILCTKFLFQFYLEFFHTLIFPLNNSSPLPVVHRRPKGPLRMGFFQDCNVAKRRPSTPLINVTPSNREHLESSTSFGLMFVEYFGGVIVGWLLRQQWENHCLVGGGEQNACPY